ncbi:MAG: phage minor head protein [Novosphingobium sp.]|nr:phage minor head protein [Novosphingobium sp.]
MFGQPFPEQVAFFRNKLGNLIPTARWDDIEGAAHDQGFMVAGAAKADLLTDLATATDKFISEGRGIEEFRRDFKSIVAKNGWTGWTGEGSVKGEAWRVGVIYRTNMYTSYSAGRFAQLQAGNFAFWVYRHGASQEPRVEHLSWNGIALEPSHVFWITHYPPSDWGCSCYVVGARTAAGVKRMGGDPDKKLPANWNARDPKTGAPVGIGRGWDYAPGASVAEVVQAMAAKVRNWDYVIAKAFMDALPRAQADALSDTYRALPSTADDARRFAQAIADGRPPALDAPVRTLGTVPARDEAKISELIGEAIEGFDYRLARNSVGHTFNEHGNQAVEALRGQRAVTAEDFAALPQILSRPDTITGPDTSNIDETLVHFTKIIDGERFTATMAINRSRRSLTLKTMYVHPGRGK